MLHTVTVTFEPADEAFLHAVAAALMEVEHVVTVRVSSHGYPAVYRIDVPRAGDADMAAAACRPALDVADRLRARARIHQVDSAPQT